MKTMVSISARALYAVLGFLLLQSAASAATGVAVPGFEVYDQKFPAFLQRWNVPGASVAVAYRGRIVFARGYGLADRDALRDAKPDTPFRIMSISKVLTASVIMKLVEDGKLSLDDRIFDLLRYPAPTYSGAKQDSRLSKITLRQVLSHTAGWVADSASNPIVGGRGFNPILYQRDIARIMGAASPASADTVVRYMMGQPLQADPGTTYAYSSFDYLLLGRLIELKTGMLYADAVRIFAEDACVSSLSMAGSRLGDLSPDEARYYDDPRAAPMASQFDGTQVPAQYSFSLPGWDSCGGWKMSAIDCLRFMLALEGKNGAPRLLQESTLAEARTPRTPSEYYGLGWFAKYACSSGDDSGHGGGSWGSKTWALRSADGDWHTVVFLNSLPTSAFTDGAFEADAFATIHSLGADQAGQWPDFTWTTLSWSDWKHRFLSATMAGELEDANGDGVPLLIEYAAGLDPLGTNNPPPARLVRYASGDTVLRYERIPLDSSLGWSVEVSEDGSSWRPLADSGTAACVAGTGTLSVTVNIGKWPKARLRVVSNLSGAQTVFEPAAPAASSARLTALSVRAESGPGDDVLIVGVSVAGNRQGEAKPIFIRGLGPALAGALDSYVRDPELKVYSGGTAIGANDDWEPGLRPAFAQVGLDNLALGSKDAALLSKLGDGGYTVHVAGKDSKTGVAMAELYEAEPSESSHLAALSVRATAGSGDKTLIGGFVVGGQGTRKVLIRGLGPSLADALGEHYLADPKIELYSYSGATNGWTLVKTNDDYQASPDLLAAFASVGMQPLLSGARDAAMLAELPAGAYTVHLSGTNGTVGIALIEIYEVP